MPKPQAPILLQDLCRKAVGRVLACLALVGLLALQTSMIWHGLEHVSNASSSAAVASNTPSVETAQPVSGPCLKCLEDLAHSVGLISQAPVLDTSLHVVVQQGALPACSFPTPVELANQRGPPVSLS